MIRRQIEAPVDVVASALLFDTSQFSLFMQDRPNVGWILANLVGDAMRDQFIAFPVFL